VIEIWVLQARALAARQETEAAIDLLQHALELAEPEGYVRVFVDEGLSMAELLRAVGRRPSAGHLRPYVGRLLAALTAIETQGAALHGPDRDATGTQANEAQGSSTAGARPPATALIEPLTERGEEVLRLVGEGASNEQIAATLVISIHTVRKHLSNIFGKLDVTNRTEAAARARTLGLL
jgi:LuxR family transcriptional regulator, maltose regulon positive regulatory protein